MTSSHLHKRSSNLPQRIQAHLLPNRSNRQVFKKRFCFQDKRNFLLFKAKNHLLKKSNHHQHKRNNNLPQKRNNNKAAVKFNHLLKKNNNHLLKKNNNHLQKICLLMMDSMKMALMRKEFIASQVPHLVLRGLLVMVSSTLMDSMPTDSIPKDSTQ